MKIPLHSQREYEMKVRQLEAKYQKKNKESTKENKRLRKRMKELSCSRDGWKSKNKSKSEELKDLRKRLGGVSAAKRHHKVLDLLRAVLSEGAMRQYGEKLGVKNGVL
jgi:hypothetical protein